MDKAVIEKLLTQTEEKLAHLEAKRAELEADFELKRAAVDALKDLLSSTRDIDKQLKRVQEHAD